MVVVVVLLVVVVPVGARPHSAAMTYPAAALVHAYHCFDANCAKEFEGTGNAKIKCAEAKGVLRRVRAHVATCPTRKANDPNARATNWPTKCKACAVWDGLYCSTPAELRRRLFAAAHAGNVEVVRGVLARAAHWLENPLQPFDIVNSLATIGPQADAQTALGLAAAAGHEQVVELLLAEDTIDVNRGPFPPLLSAAVKGHTRIVAKLLAAGADVEVHHRDGPVTPLFAALTRNHLRVIQLLSSYGAKRTLRFGLLVRTAEQAADMREAAYVTAFLRESRDWSALAHLEVLTPERARALIAGGAAVDGAGAGSPSPLARAKALCPFSFFSAGDAAHIVLEHGAPWTRVTHEFYPPPVRALARELMRIAYAIRIGKAAHKVDGALRPFVEPGAVADVFEQYMIPRLLASTRWRNGMLDTIA